MNWREYEKLVAGVARNVIQKPDALPIGAVRCGKQNFWRGASGFKHQIDVSIQGPDRVSLVECKCWGHSVPVEVVLTLQGRLDDIRPKFTMEVEGVIVTNKDFQSGARKVSQHFGIHCDLVRSAEEFGFKYTKHLIVQPRPASFKGSSSIGSIVSR